MNEIEIDDSIFHYIVLYFTNKPMYTFNLIFSVPEYASCTKVTVERTASSNLNVNF